MSPTTSMPKRSIATMRSGSVGPFTRRIEGDEQRDAEHHERDLRDEFEHGIPVLSCYSNNSLTRRSKPFLISRRVSSALFMCMTCT